MEASGFLRVRPKGKRDRDEESGHLDDPRVFSVFWALVASIFARKSVRCYASDTALDRQMQIEIWRRVK